MKDNKKYSLSECLNYDFGRALKKIRQMRGFTSIEVYDGICSKGTYSKIESGETKNPSILLMQSFCSRMGIDISVLVEEARPADEQLICLIVKETENHLANFSERDLKADLDQLESIDLTKLPTKLRQKISNLIVILKVQMYGNYDNATAELYDMLDITYHDDAEFITSREAKIYNLLLRTTNLDERVFLKVVEIDKKLQTNNITKDSRTHYLLAIAIAYNYFYSENWTELLSHTRYVLGMIKKTDHMLLTITITWMHGLALYYNKSVKIGTTFISRALILSKFTNLDFEYNEIIDTVKKYSIDIDFNKIEEVCYFLNII